MRNFVFEDFVELVGSRFVWRDSDPELAFVLEQATPLPANYVAKDVRPPFQLIFRMDDDRVFPQSLYLLDHPELGEAPIFLVPAEKNADGVRYCASFS